MQSLDPAEEVDHILSALTNTPGSQGLQLREIHEILAGYEDSSFTHSPPRGEGYNIERYLLKGLVEYLNVKEGLISADGTKWTLTPEGRREVQ